MDEKAKNGQGTVQNTYELAGLPARALALIIDGFLLLAALVILSVILAGIGDSLPEYLIHFSGLALPVAYNWYFWTRRDGQTPGKFALGIRVVKADGTAFRDIDAVIRSICYQVSAWFFCLGYIWAIFDKKNQTWHDKLAGTVVVRSGDRRNMVDVG